MGKDRFDEKTKRALQDRVGNRCSNPGCRCLTSGPNANPEKATRIGIAAHITADSSGGPRYDSGLSSQERKSAQNGIWLCATCASFIDTDQGRYPIDLLKNWKTQAEAVAFDETQGRKPVKLRPPEIKEVGWDCPYCDTTVGLTKSVCRGCHAKVVHGITEDEVERLLNLGLLIGIVLSIFIFVSLPQYFSQQLGWETGIFYGRELLTVSIFIVIIIGLSMFLTVVPVKIRLSGKTRFMRQQ